MVVELGCEGSNSEKEAHKGMCKSGTEAKKARYKNMKNRAKNVVVKAMKEAAEQELRAMKVHRQG